MAGKKEYRSAVRSKRMIKQAFIELIKLHPFDKITVTDIVKLADINRSTFYAHYSDIYDLADSMTNDILDKTSRLIAELDIVAFFSDPKPFLYQLFQVGIENVELYRLSESSDFAAKQVQRIKGVLVEKTIDSIDLPQQVTKSSMFQFHANFFLGGILNIYQLWATGKLICSIDQIVDEIATLITNNAHIYEQRPPM